MPAFLDLRGSHYGKLTVIERVPSDNRQTKWLCRCDCGNKHIVEARNLRGGGVKSCGCSSNDMRSTNSSNATHRMSKTPTYKSWMMMRMRCDNPHYSHYEYYGARGIKYTERWQTFTNFLEDMGIRPDGKTLDRKDSNGDYCKENCRWATTDEQLANRRNSNTYTVNGMTKTLKEWAEIVGSTRERLYNYLYRMPELSLEGVLYRLNLMPRVIEYQTGGALNWD